MFCCHIHFPEAFLQEPSRKEMELSLEKTEDFTNESKNLQGGAKRVDRPCSVVWSNRTGVRGINCTGTST